jgi:hypothetical protein
MGTKNEHAPFVYPMRKPRDQPIPFFRVVVEHVDDLGDVFVCLERV